MKYLLLLSVLFFIGCKKQEKEPPFEWLTFYATDDQRNPGFKIYSHTMKRYYHESIGEMLDRNEKYYGVTMKGRWMFSGIVIEFSNTQRDTIKLENAIFHDTIKSTFKKQTK